VQQHRTSQTFILASLHKVVKLLQRRSQSSYLPRISNPLLIQSVRSISLRRHHLTVATLWYWSLFL
jgi:hypothetical protein